MAASDASAGAAEETARPEGELLWVHAGTSTTPSAVVALIQRLRSDRPELSILCTVDETDPVPADEDTIYRLRPDESAAAVDGFLSHWRPDIGLWLGTPVWPRLLHEARRRALPAILADVTAARGGPFGFGPDHVVDLFDHVLAGSVTDAEILRRACAAPRRVEASAALREGPAPPLCDQEELEALMRANAGRPVWLAMGLPEAEVEAASRAHRRASRLSHRLLMVITPDSPRQGQILARRLEDLGWHTALRSAGAVPSEPIAVYVADLEDEDALWCRFAPITFLGGSLSRPGRGRDPMVPAALGSAIVHGPWTEGHRFAFKRLKGSSAAWQIADAEELGAAVADLQSPERAATMANAAWQVASEGAEVTDRIIALVVDLLDRAP